MLPIFRGRRRKVSNSDEGKRKPSVKKDPIICVEERGRAIGREKRKGCFALLMAEKKRHRGDCR